jgi:2-succinyl-5-enolpyruvyl-6-hydroxy-3-cyclohexene-1-carboxylate synthase
MIIQPLVNLVDLCARKGIRHVVISPGSRSAALTLAFARHPNLETKVIPDERAAGFIALGLAQATGRPVALVCTSGTAAYNFAPAVAEAFFQEIPLVVLTADRPPEWIQQRDGQMIFQNGIFGRHVKESVTLPADFTHSDTVWFVERLLNQNLDLCVSAPKGPIHVNVPIREPFYPEPDETLQFNHPVRIIERVESHRSLSASVWAELVGEWEDAERVLIAVGQGYPVPGLIDALRTLSDEFGVVILGDVIANLPGTEPFLGQQDAVMMQGGASLESLRPDLLITCGQSFVSKNLKLFLRRYPPRAHWHVAISDVLVDPFQTLTKQVPVEADYFFKTLVDELEGPYIRSALDEEEHPAAYRTAWFEQERRSKRTLQQLLTKQLEFNEFSAVAQVLERVPDRGQLHLANSMAVRYANFVGRQPHQQIRVFANRGTSGIDGCLSTAVGAAMATDEPVVALIGDIAFFYDRNALWHPHVPPNLRIVLLNNHGGNIFRMIDGPARQPELVQYFETPHELNARRTAEEFGLRYQRTTDATSLQAALDTFFEPTGDPALLEIETDRAINAQVFTAFKAVMRTGSR